MIKIGQGLITALVISAITSSSVAEEIGTYYHVQVESLNLQTERDTDSDLLLVYKKADGSLALQLYALAQRDSVGFLLKREDMPDVAAALFQSFDDLVVSYWPTRRSTGQPDYQTIELLTDTGQPVNLATRLLDITGAPLKDLALRYTGQRIVENQQTTETVSGTIRTSRNGFAPLNAGNHGHQFFQDMINYQVDAIEPGSGTMVLNLTENRMPNRSGRYNTITLPLLDDWATSSSEIAIFSGQIFNSEGHPAAGARFQVIMPANSRHYDVALYEYAAGPEGKFKLAFKRDYQNSDDFSMQIENGGGTIERFSLTPNEPIVINVGAIRPH